MKKKLEPGVSVNKLNWKCIGNISVLFKQDLPLTLIDVLVDMFVGWVRVEIIGFSTLIFLFAQALSYSVCNVHNGQGNAFWIHFVFYVTRENNDILATDFPLIFGYITYGLLLFKLYMIWSLTCLHRVVNIPRSIQPHLVTGEFIVNLLEWTNKGQSVNTTL